jgi:hypothetical protein
LSDETNNPLGLHFEHEWQREAWEMEMAERRERKARLRVSEVEAASGNVLELLQLAKPTLLQDTVNGCSAAHFGAERDADVESCDRVMHYRFDKQHRCPVAVGRCPELRRAEMQSVYDRERKRLEGELAVIARLGSVGFMGYDISRGTCAVDAWRAAIAFSEGRPPKRNLFFAGTTGLGKTRLMLASHFALLRAGVRSVYVTSPELRGAFDDQRAYDEELREQGTAMVERLVRSAAVHLDDLGNVEDDDRKRGLFAEGLKKILDRSGAAWFAATNLTWDDATRHPDVGSKVLSRLVSGADVVKIEGKDYRVEHSKRLGS